MTSTRIITLTLWLIVVSTSVCRSDDKQILVPEDIKLESTKSGDWIHWQGIVDVKRSRERITALTAASDTLWVGTSYADCCQ